MFRPQTEKELIDKILNYQQFLKKWDDPSITRFRHIEKIENVPYMELKEEKEVEKKEDGFQRNRRLEEPSLLGGIKFANQSEAGRKRD